ncbi:MULTISPECIES: cellulose binding domain-containing protein [Micromonospora]|uniref:cellulose binding domain-containing protein n=1 Tax=Micromonospora TaxID=1873 RepID=UPI00064BECE6|nr:MULTISPECIES: cellulose binding domain-containing protein [unclassified Micromonospora]MDG4752128.1 cellulose binding domain-containing protein [Micromonospora sp. WMMD718]
MTVTKKGRPWRTALVLGTTAALAALGAVTAVTAQAAAGCRVDYRVSSEWSGGFNADVTITNLGDAVNGWRLAWTFPAGQQVTQSWNATVTAGTSSVTATNVDWNAALPAGGSVSFGFTGSRGATNPAPTVFTLNGTACTGGVTPTTGAPSPTPTAPPAGVPYSNAPDGFAGAAGTTGGAAGATVTVTSQADLERYAASSTPYVIRVGAAITVSPYGREIPVGSNKTIVGVGRNGQIVNGGFHLGAGTANVIIRNLTIRDTRVASDDPDDKDFDYDGIQMDTANRIWIDHNTITRMNDGLIDSRKDTTNLTVSWNVIAEGNKAFGIGWTDNVTARITMHHNWIHDTNVRNPSTDNVQYAHFFNNYLQNIRGYGNYSRGRTKLVIENSYYENVKDPYYRDDTAELRQSGSVCVGCTGQRETGGSAFTPSSFYSYRLDPAAQVPALLRTYAGPQAAIGQ